MEKVVINIAKDFSPTPGPRYTHEGKHSGEDFRKTVLFPRVKSALDSNSAIEVQLDGTAGYGTSFLEESFGGLIRIHGLPYNRIKELLTLVSKEEDYLIDDINEYLNDAHEEQSK